MTAASGPRRAVVFDVDGTLVDSERDGHRVAFNAAFAAAGLPDRWGAEVYGRLLRTAGGRQRIAAWLGEQGVGLEAAQQLAARLHKDKTARFRALVEQGRIPARPGVQDLVDRLAGAQITVAVATTGTKDWVDPLLARLFPPDTFATVVTGTDVPQLKPDPAVYVETLARLRLEPGQALAVEDSYNGLRAARDAGLACLVVTNDYTRDQDFTGALAVVPDFGAAVPVIEEWLQVSPAVPEQ